MKIPRIMFLHFHDLGGKTRPSRSVCHDLLAAVYNLTPVIATRLADRVGYKGQKPSALNGHGHTALLTAIQAG